MAKPDPSALPRVHILSDGTPAGTLMHHTGKRVPEITRIDINIEPDWPVMAHVTVLPTVDVEAHAIFSIENIAAMAAYHGYRLVAIRED